MRQFRWKLRREIGLKENVGNKRADETTFHQTGTMAPGRYSRLALIASMSLQSVSPLAPAVVLTANPSPTWRYLHTAAAANVSHATRSATTSGAAASASVFQCFPGLRWHWSISTSPSSSFSAAAAPRLTDFSELVPKFGATEHRRRMSSSASSTPSSFSSVTPDDVIQFWFRDLDPENNVFVSKSWFAGGPQFDTECGKKFGASLKLAREGRLSDWMNTARGRLALVIVLDQFARNIDRTSPEQFSQDGKAREIALQTIQQGWDKELSSWERRFLYMPFMHSEKLQDHDLMQQLLKDLMNESIGNESLYDSIKDTLDFELSHSSVIQRFGRYPSRNALLGRENTEEEEKYLAEGKIWG